MTNDKIIAAATLIADFDTLSPPVQSPDDIWREMRLLMEWNEGGLSLCFLFAPDGASLAPLRQWTDDAWQWRTAPLTQIDPADPLDAAPVVLQTMQAHLQRLGMTRAPVWVQMLAQDVPTQAGPQPADSPSWEGARAALLSRLNESREWLVRDFARPLVLCLPLGWQHKVVLVAPDLWQVRSFTAVLPGTAPRAAPAMAADAMRKNGR